MIKGTYFRATIAMIAITATVMPCVPASAQTFHEVHFPYRAYDLGDLGGRTVYPMGINNSGQIVGYADQGSNGVLHAFVWDHINKMKDLGGDPSVETRAMAVNNNGLIVGDFFDGSHRQAFAYNGTSITPLGYLLNGDATLDSSTATAVNDNGDIVGYSRYFDGATALDRGVVFTRGLQDVGSLLTNPGDTGTSLYGINDAGTIVGSSFVFDTGPYTGTYSDAITTTGSGVFDINNTGQYGSEARAVNQAGDIVGYALFDNAGRAHAFLSDHTTGGLRNLQSSVSLESTAYGINNHGQVVGDELFPTYGAVYSPFVWDNANGMRDLQGLIVNYNPYNAHVTGINDSGWIVGYGPDNHGLGQTRGFVLKPLPTGSLAAPTNLNAVYDHGTGHVTWTDTQSNVGYYVVYVKRPEGSDFYVLGYAVVPHFDDQVQAGATTQYKVKAVNATMDSAFSSTFTLTVPPPPQINTVAPLYIKTNHSATVTVTGSSFQQSDKAYVGGTRVGLHVIDSNDAQLSISPDAIPTAGNYYVNVVDPLYGSSNYIYLHVADTIAPNLISGGANATTDGTTITVNLSISNAGTADATGSQITSVTLSGVAVNETLPVLLDDPLPVGNLSFRTLTFNSAATGSLDLRVVLNYSGKQRTLHIPVFVGDGGGGGSF